MRWKLGLICLGVLFLMPIAQADSADGLLEDIFSALDNSITGWVTQDFMVAKKPTTKVYPILECVKNNGDGTYTAFFGYNNTNSEVTTIDVGNHNKFAPPPQDRGQPSVFQPGRTTPYPNSAFSMVFDGKNIVWILQKTGGAVSTPTVSANAPRCFDDVPVDVPDDEQEDQEYNETEEEYNETLPQVCIPSEEICDGIDNDCDDLIDEQVTRTCGTSNIGVCQLGTEICNSGLWGKCEGAIDPDIEICDNIDNDCDGQIDEQVTQSCGINEGVCTTGTQTCTTGSWSDCSGTQPAEELCDALDNNCDGQIDENCGCEHGAIRACGSDTGTCAAGTQECIFGEWDVCENQITPIEELCDGLDNDCDGQIDEEVTQACGASELGICQKGTQTCTAGEWNVCENAILPAIEMCDAIDNDCDGQIDESCIEICTPEEEICDGKDNDCDGVADEDCGLGQTCVPDPEICDGVDNDCDGQIDEGCPPPTPECIPQPETCDGLDNNCNNIIDENLTQSCGSNIGACEEGIETCQSGAWSQCTNEIIAANEFCDGIDNNCDGAIDNGIGCECTNGETRSCGTDTGICATGSQSCTGGTWGTCNNAIEATAEICDGLDNDCDGEIDEVLTKSCGTTDVGICSYGTQTCTNATWTECKDSIEPQSETCNNNLDDNCDGSIDESCQAPTVTPPSRGGGGGGSSRRTITTPVSVQTIAIATPSVSIEKKSADPVEGLQIEITSAPTTVEIKDPTFTIEANVQNLGSTELQNIDITPKTSSGWESKSKTIASLAPNEIKPIQIEVDSVLCPPEEDLSYKLTQITFAVTAETGVLSDKDDIEIPVDIPSFSVITPQSKDNEIRVCYIINNDRDIPREQLEIEFELYDQKNDQIIDFISPIRVEPNSILIKSKTYDLDFPFEQKIYNTRSYLYEGGSVFSDSYIAGRARGAVDLTEASQKERVSLWQRIKNLFK